MKFQENIIINQDNVQHVANQLSTVVASNFEAKIANELPKQRQEQLEKIKTVATEIQQNIQKQVEKLMDSNQIDALNSKSYTQLVENGPRMVRFVGMVQDNSLPPELFSEMFWVKEGDQERWTLIKYTDQMPNSLQTHDANGQTIRQVVPAHHFLPSFMGERQCYYIVAAPGENAWVNGMDVKFEQRDTPQDKDLQILLAKHPLGVGSSESDVPFSVLALVDNVTSPFKLHETYEFFGIIEPTKDEPVQEDVEDAFGTTKLPPPSLLPRLHVIAHRSYQPQTSNIIDLSKTRAELVSRFAKDLFAGDENAAEWFLLHLVSSIFHRSPGFMAGSLPINLTFPKESIELAKSQGLKIASAKEIHDYLSQMLPRTLLIPLTISFLNSQIFTPVMSDCNGLQAGMLQLARGTQLIVDETGLTTGTLKGNGVLNVHALKSVLQHGKLPVGVPAAVQTETTDKDEPKEKTELTLGWMETDVDVNILVYGDSSKSGILPVECVVPVQPNNDPSQALSSLSIDDGFISRAREYFARVKQLSYTTSDMSSVIVSDFTKSRELARNQAPATNDEDALKTLLATEEDLAHLCNVARWMAISYGGQETATLTESHWTDSKKLELERRRRVTRHHPKIERQETVAPRAPGALRTGQMVA